MFTEDTMKLVDFFVQYYAPIRLLGKSRRTRVLYMRSIQLLTDTLGRNATLNDLDDCSVAGHLQRLLDDGLAVSTVAKERSQLLAIANFAARRGHLQRWLDVATIHVPERIPKAWSLDELCRIMRACMNAPGFCGGVNARIWWTSLHLVLWDTGERIGAIMSSRWADLNDDAIIIRAENRKARTRDKLYPLRHETLRWLEMARKPVRDLIWPWHGCKTTIWGAYDEILTAAGVDSDRTSKFHKMRKSVASHLKALGGDPTAALDHANPRTTRSYIDPRIARIAPLHTLLPRITDPSDSEDSPDKTDH